MKEIERMNEAIEREAEESRERDRYGRINRTTDLKKVRAGKPFTWGVIDAIWDVGPYTVARFYQWKRDGSSILMGKVDPRKSAIEFHGWIDGESTSLGTSTLEGMLASLMARKFDGLNSQAAGRHSTAL